MSEKKGVLEKAKNSKTFCIYPFSHLATKTEGTFKLCCRSEPISNVNETSAVELWNSDHYKEIRRKFLNSERPEECQDCWALEDMGTRSMRERALADFPGSRWNSYSQYLDDVSEDGEVPYLPKSIELKLSNLCNLRCRMCHPVDSSSWVKDWSTISDLMAKHNMWAYKAAESHNVEKKPLISGFEHNEQWWDDFDKMVDSIDLIEFAGGEPLIDPLHYRILDKLMRRAEHIRLKYSTNMTKLEFKKTNVLDYWKKFKSVSVYASIDGIHDVYDYIRTGASFPEIEANLNSLQEAKDIEFDELAVACTIQVYNVFQLPEIIDYFLKRGIRFHSHRVTAPTFLNTQVLPEAVKTELKRQVLEYLERLIEAKDYPPHVIRNVTRHINDHVNHMTGRDWTYLTPALEDYTLRLDEKRGTNYKEVIPELVPVFENYRAESSRQSL